ncbi:PhoX domain-containing protein [Cyathus striatus]|nr:PhoX domain-containing protein [Cyathus striatus]
MHHFNTRAVVLVGLLAIVLPIISRIISSPLALLILAPFVLFSFAISFFCLSVYVGHVLDTKTPLPDHNLYSAARPFSFSTPAAWQAVLTRSQWSQNAPQLLPPLCPDDAELSAILNEVIAMVIRDFVMSWYEGLSNSPSFPTAVSTLLHTSLENIISRATEIDVSALIVKRIMPKVTAHIEQFRESEVALRGAELERRLTQSDELDLLLASRYATKAGGKLHPAVENLSTTFTKQTEEMHIRKLVSKAIPQILPQKDSKSKGLQIVVREIVTCSVLYPVLEMLTDPDFWNRSIDNIAGAAIHQQKLITKVRNILEAQSPRSVSRLSPAQHLAGRSTERITVHTDARQFESFLRSISRTSSLLDARRLKNDIMGEIRRTRLLLANHEKEDWINGEKTEDVVAFLDRLYTAKRKVDERISHLGGGNDSSFPIYQEAALKSGSSLRDVLRNPNSLSYFMEFMDRRNRSLPVQFWLTVESFKNPLESVDSDSSANEEETIQDTSSTVNIKEDISMIKDLYFSSLTTHPALSSISKRHIEIIQEFVSEPDPSHAAQRRVRRSVLLAQRQIEREMEQDFEDFERSELWFRAVNDTEVGAYQVAADPFGEILPPESSLSTGSGKDSKVESTPVFPMQRSSSSTSSRSVRTPAMPGYVPSSIEVLMSPISESSAESTRAPLFNDMEDELQRAEEQRMEAIHAALTDIMALEDDGNSLDSGVHRTGPELGSDALKYTRRSAQSTYEGHDLFGDDMEDPEVEPEGQHDIHVSYEPAAPGDLQLVYEIARLGDKIINLKSQQSMLESLLKKAELTGDIQELKLLKKSRASMDRELREIEFQKTQYEQQEKANRLLSDRTKWPSSGGKAVVRYLVEVKQLATNGSFSSGWVVARRYNEFFSMHNKLKERYALVRQLDFPGKRLVTSLSGSFLDNRRAALEKYLQSLISIPAVCESEELRGFLSRSSPFVASASQVSPSKMTGGFSGANLVRNMYRSVTESIDDMFFGPSMLDVMIQRLTRQAAEFAGIVGSAMNDEDLVAQALNASGKAASEATLLGLSGDLRPLEGETSTSTFSAPICDLILVVFDLNKKNNWLRRQATVIILQQVLGGTIERKFREHIKSFLQDGKCLSLLRMLQDSLWPGGKLKTNSTVRTMEDKIRTRDEANRKLSFLIPDLASNMIGRSNARRGARRIFAVLQNRRLNQHIVYTVIDEVFSAIFPEVNISES